VRAYERFGARACVPIYNAVSPATHHPVPKDARFRGDLAFCGNRMPDRESRVQEFFFRPARLRPNRRFLLGGNGWDGKVPTLSNLAILGHIYTADHNAFNASPLAVLNVCRASMARFGFSPPTRIFEAAGAGACIITDDWEGIDLFLEPAVECLVAQNGEGVAAILDGLSPDQARRLGERARDRVLAEHTYTRRAERVEQCLWTSPYHPVEV
jgi:spore maturation protein CgeB